MTDKSWMEQQVDNALIDVADVLEQAERLLEMSETNSQQTPAQSAPLIWLRMKYEMLKNEDPKWIFLMKLHNSILQLQLTAVDSPEGARKDFANVLLSKVTQQDNQQEKKKKGIFG